MSDREGITASWLRRFTGRSSDKALNLLREHLAPFEEFGAETVEQLASFVLEGEHESVIKLVRKDPRPGSRLGLHACTQGRWGEELNVKRACQANLIRALGKAQLDGEVSPEATATIFCRLGRLWYELAREPGRKLRLEGEAHGTPKWLETLQDELYYARRWGGGTGHLFVFLDAPEIAAVLTRRGENTDAVTLLGLGLYCEPFAHNPDMEIPQSKMRGLAKLIASRPEGVMEYFHHEGRSHERLRAALTIRRLLKDAGWRLLEEAAELTQPAVAQMAFATGTQARWPKLMMPVVRELIMEHGEQAAATVRHGTEEERLECLKMLAELLGGELVKWLDHHQVPGEIVVQTLMRTLRDEYAYQMHQLGAWKRHGKLLARHPEVVSAALVGGDAKARLAILRFLYECRVPPEGPVAALAECASGTAKTVREAALPLLLQCPQAALEALLSRLSASTAAERFEAVRMIGRLKLEPPAKRLREHLEGEKSARVRKAIEELISAPTPEVRQLEDQQTDDRIRAALPEPRDPGLDAEVPADLAERFADAYRLAYDKQLADWRKQQENPPEYAWQRVKKPAEMPPGWPADVVSFAAAGNAENRLAQRKAVGSKWPFGWTKPFEKILRAEDLTLAQKVRLWLLFGFFSMHGTSVKRVDYRARGVFMDWLSRPGNGLRDLSVTLRALGFDDDQLAADYLTNAARVYSYWRISPEQAWPFLADHVPVIREYLSTRGRGEDKRFSSYDEGGWMTATLAVLPHFPELPRDIEDELWPMALGTTKSFRVESQDCLTRLGRDVAPRVISALADGKKDIRLAAAQWLSRMGEPEAAPELKKALKKERLEEVRAAMLTALEAAGESIDDFFGPVRLLNEAKKKLVKGLPKDLSFLPLDRLPRVRWANGKKVTSLILHWELAKALKVKQIAPSALQLRLGAALDDADREALGQWVLEAWLGHDQALLSRDEALAAAEQEARQYMRWHKSQTLEEWIEELLPQYLDQPRSSATRQKGLLSLVSAYGGAEVAAPIHRYLKQWFGHRAPQCKMLLEVLSHVEHPQATQVLVSVSTRFRTAGIRKEALRLVEVLAERRGWTRDQLADRTIPTAGLGEDGTLSLDTGKRRFTLLLDEELKLALENPAGKVVKAMSGPNKGEDADRFKAAKKQLSAARKELKQVLALQRGRLYEAMCTQRHWSYEEWDEYLNRHPIMGRFCQRLVWVAEDASGARLAIFRPMEDRSLTDADDDEVSLPGNARLRLAHVAVEPAAIAESWREHLADYEVMVLFPQLDGEAYALPEKLRAEDEIRDFEGWVIDSRKLHSLAGKLGWTRAQAEDAGFYDCYFKHFQTLGQKAALGFSGLCVGEPGRDVALVKLQFVHASEQGDDSTWYQHALQLGDVPPVLLSECYGDLRRIAEAGSGHDPKWKKNIDYWGE